MSIERSRFSGTASLFNRLNQLFFAIKFWLYIALGVAVIVFVWRAYPVLKDLGTMEFFIRASLYEFTVRTGQPWPWLVGETYRTAVVSQTQEYHGLYGVILNSLKKSGYEGLGGGMLVLIFGFWLGRKEARSQTEDRHRRGSQLVIPKELNRCLIKTEGDGQIMLGEVRLPRATEVRGLFTIGMLGVGKTQLQNCILDTVVDRDERGVIFTAKGDDFITTHWRSGDKIFCPADERTVGWSLMNDITDLSDFDIIAESLVDDSNEKTKVWGGGAKMIIAGLLKYCYLVGHRSNRQVCDVFSHDAQGMRDCLRYTPGAEQAAGLLAEPGSSPANSFFITVCLYTRPLQLLKHLENDFSITEWVKSGSGRIYLPATPKLQRQLGPLYSVFIDLLIVHHLSLPNDSSRRIWYGLDELAALGKIPGLSQLANLGRSKGAAILAGTQSYPQLDLIYGPEQRRALLNGFATKLVFRNEDEQTLEELSKAMGRREIERARENLSTPINSTRGGVTRMSETAEDVLILPDEIKNLPALHFYVQSSGYPVTKTSIDYKEWPELIPAHLPHPEMSLVALREEFEHYGEGTAPAKKTGNNKALFKKNTLM